MILASPGETRTFVPPSEERRDPAHRVAYRLRVPSVWDRTRYRGALGAHGVRSHSVVPMLDAMAQGVRAIYGDADSAAKDAHLDVIAQYRAEAVALGQRLLDGSIDVASEEGRAAFTESMGRQQDLDQALADVAEIVAQGYPPYAQMRADNASFALGRGVVAAQMFLVGWENVPRPFARTDAGVPEALLAQLPEHHLIAIGAEVERLMAPTEPEAKNSDSPSSTGPSLMDSTAASTSDQGPQQPETSSGRSPNSASPLSGSIPPTS